MCQLVEPIIRSVWLMMKEHRVAGPGAFRQGHHVVGGRMAERRHGRDFLGQQLGVVARHYVSRGIRARWSDTRALRVLGVGYATPYLGLFREEA